MLDLLGDGRLCKEVLREGLGAQAQKGDFVNFHHVVKSASGATIDDSKLRGAGQRVRLGDNEVIPGWEHALASMRQGEVAAFKVHPDLAYGEAGCNGGAVPPTRLPGAEESSEGVAAASLLCELELLHVDSGSSTFVEGELSAEETLKSAARAKEDGNARFKAGDWAGAADSYGAAIKLLGYEQEAEADPSLTLGVGTQPSDVRWEDAARREAREQLAFQNFLNLAQCQLRLNQPFAAVLAATEALKLQPQNAKALYRRGLARLQNGDLVQAKDDLHEAARKEPRNGEIREKLQECIQRLQEAEKAERGTFGGMFGRGSLYNEKKAIAASAPDTAPSPSEPSGKATRK